MKRTDAFMLGVTIFVVANCISYFVLSGTPYVTGWGEAPGEYFRWFERIGFPFVICDVSVGGFTPGYSWSWINGLGNVAIAITVSCLFSMRLGNSVPPLWRLASSLPPPWGCALGVGAGCAVQEALDRKRTSSFTGSCAGSDKRQCAGP